ncbi:hypothetical protein HMPREF0658_1055 [Hoylesella marshii DSM 16973 = JCM 13450]|uniref:Uncharacterized protein n=1 Tax=Hoylesella marshii DSM 16973 = JCM 13450 TaxID=862515 RepID=E0NSA4_9BACT|nr:hypothetical protein HMPREF0658_1055 [Hoylesella marshii DSM 16973 = JCM 13450]
MNQADIPREYPLFSWKRCIFALVNISKTRGIDKQQFNINPTYNKTTHYGNRP